MIHESMIKERLLFVNKAAFLFNFYNVNPG